MNRRTLLTAPLLLEACAAIDPDWEPSHCEDFILCRQTFPGSSVLRAALRTIKVHPFIVANRLRVTFNEGYAKKTGSPVFGAFVHDDVKKHTARCYLYGQYSPEDAHSSGIFFVDHTVRLIEDEWFSSKNGIG